MIKKEVKILFQEFPFYNIFIEKSRIKHLKNIDLLHKLPFYDTLKISKKISKALKQPPLVELEASKSSTTDLFKDLLDENKAFKYQITVHLLLKSTKKIET